VATPFAAIAPKKTAPLPQFGLAQLNRVCDACYDKLTRQSKSVSSASTTAAAAAPAKAAPKAAPTPSLEASKATTSAPKPAPVAVVAATPVKECKCGMPLCICQEKKPDASAAAPASAAAAKPNSSEGSSTSSSSSSSSSSSLSSAALFRDYVAPTSSLFGASARPTYDLNGDLNEQCREAVKSGDTEGVKQLLKAGASVSYKDKSGNSFVHIAAIFNRLELVDLLVKNGASLLEKNSTNETPIDVAQPALQHKMKEMLRQ